MALKASNLAVGLNGPERLQSGNRNCLDQKPIYEAYIPNLGLLQCPNPFRKFWVVLVVILDREFRVYL